MRRPAARTSTTILAGVVLVMCGCRTSPGDELASDSATVMGSGEEQLDSSSETGEGDSTDEAGSEDSGDPLPECPAPGPVTDWVNVGVDFPGRDDVNPEADASERDATCMIVDSIGEEMLFELELICDEIDGELQQPYTITFESLQVPTASLLALDSPIELSYRWWYAFEFGSGSRLSLAQDGEVRLLAYSETSGRGHGTCATSDGSLRVRAEQWLAPIDTRIESAACGDESMLRLARMTQRGDAYAYPTEIVEFDDGVTMVVGPASCEFFDDEESWSLYVVAWR